MSGSPEKGIRNASQIASQKIQQLSTTSRRERIGSLYRQIMGVTAAFSSTDTNSNDSHTRITSNVIVNTSSRAGVGIIENSQSSQESKHSQAESVQESADSRYFCARREESAEENKINFDWVGKLVRDVEVDIIYKIVGVVYRGSKRKKDAQLFKYHRAATGDPSDNDMEYTYCSEIISQPNVWQVIIDVDQAVHLLTDKYHSNTKLTDINVDDIGLFGLATRSMQRIPQKIVPKVRAVYIKYLEQLLDDTNNVGNWRDFFLIGIILLSNNKVQSIVNHVNDKANLLLEGIWDFKLSDLCLRRTMKNQETANISKNHHAAQSFLSNNELSRAYNRLQSDTRQIPRNVDTAQKLGSMFFKPREEAQPTEQELAKMWSYPTLNDRNDLVITVSENELSSVLRKMPKLVAPGLDQTTREHVISLWGLYEKDPRPDTLRYRSLLTRFINIFLSGKIPATVRGLVYDANLVALPKPGKPISDVRPISLISFYRKLAGKIADMETAEFREVYFGGLQCASRRGGAEEIGFAVNTSLQQKKSNSVWLPDANKGYNNVAVLLSIAREITPRLPQIIPFLRSVYGNPKKSWFNINAEGKEYDHEVFKYEAEEGVDQGCPNAQFIYAMGIHPMIKAADEILGEDEFVKFLADDGNISAKFETMLKIIDIFDIVGKEVGWFRSLTKGTFLLGSCNGDINEAKRRIEELVTRGIPRESIKLHPDDAPHLSEDFGAIACGNIVGSDQYVQKHLDMKLKELEKEAEALTQFDKKQGLHLLLKFCFSRKINHLQRSTRPSLIQPFVEKFDIIRRRSFDKIIGEDVSDMTWKLICSPEGLGYPDILNATRPAYIAAVCESKASTQKIFPAFFAKTNSPTIREFHESITIMNNLIEKDDQKLQVDHLNKRVEDASAKHLTRQLQNFIMERIKPTIYEDLLMKMAVHYDTFETRNIFHHHIKFIKTQSSITSTAWHSAPPKSKTHSFSNDQFENVVRLHLFLPQRCLVNGAKCEVGSHICDSRGHHLLSCPQGGGVIRRHDHMVNIVESMTRIAGIKCSQDVKRVFQTQLPNENKRPDLWIHGEHGKKDTVADVRVCLPTRISERINREDAENNYKRHITEAFNHKINKHGQAAAINNLDFIPMIITTTGMLEKHFEEYLNKLTKRMAPDDPYLQNVYHRYWMTFISCAIQKSNATIILDRAKAINGDAIFIPREAEYNVKYYMDQRMDN